MVRRAPRRAWPRHPLDDRTRQRATFLLDNVVAAAAPTNVPLVNPASAKVAYDTAGASLLRGLRQFIHDVQRPPRLPQFSDSSAYTIGKDLAVTPGAVVRRGEVFELLQYAPGAEQRGRGPRPDGGLAGQQVLPARPGPEDTP